jgi:hypothetical protein
MTATAMTATAMTATAMTPAALGKDRRRAQHQSGNEEGEALT